MKDRPEEILLEEAVAAYRGRTESGRILPSPAWQDLPPESRDRLFERQLQSRLIERALSPGGMSATVRAVLHRLQAVER